MLRFVPKMRGGVLDAAASSSGSLKPRLRRNYTLPFLCHLALAYPAVYSCK